MTEIRRGKGDYWREGVLGKSQRKTKNWIPKEEEGQQEATKRGREGPCLCFLKSREGRIVKRAAEVEKKTKKRRRRETRE